MRTLSWGNLQAIDYLEKELHKGGVILAEGDTVLGLLADVSEKGYAQLDLIKNRSKKPYLILVETPKKALNLIEKTSGQSFQIEKLMEVCWPGPVTLIFKAKPGLISSGKSADGTIAIRVPDHAGLLQLLARFDALFSTSANSSGDPVPNSLDEVNSIIKNSVVATVVNEHQQSSSALPSTIIDCTGDVLKVIRQGAFDVNRLVGMIEAE